MVLIKGKKLLGKKLPVPFCKGNAPWIFQHTMFSSLQKKNIEDYKYRDTKVSNLVNHACQLTISCQITLPEQQLLCEKEELCFFLQLANAWQGTLLLSISSLQTSKMLPHREMSMKEARPLFVAQRQNNFMVILCSPGA